MFNNDYKELVNRLVESPDDSVRRLGNCMKEVFFSETRCPSEDILDDVDEINDGIGRYFPTPFALKYQFYQEAGEDLESHILTSSDHIALSFQSTTKQLLLLWKLILNFLPFLFVGTIQRMDSDLINEVAQKELQAALTHYDKLFHDGRGNVLESQQVILVDLLLKLFRKLDKANVLDDQFILHELMMKKGGFNEIIPPRFNRILNLIGQFRNQEVHNYLSEKGKDVIVDVYRLISWAFLDIVNSLLVVFKRYNIIYVTAINVETNSAVVQSLAFTGASLPKRTRFVLSGTRYADSERIASDELYLVDRTREIRQGRQPKFLDPSDYLCLSPFLIYTLGEKGEETEVPIDIDGNTKKIFVFQKYNNKKREFNFLEFAGRMKFLLPCQSIYSLTNIISTGVTLHAKSFSVRPTRKELSFLVAIIRASTTPNL
jgi:hypothetical protein